MSRIFAIATVSTVLLAGGAAISVTYQNSSSDSAQFEAFGELFASGVEASVLVPFVLMAGLALASLGVLSRA